VVVIHDDPDPPVPEPHAFAPLTFYGPGGRPSVTDWCGFWAAPGLEVCGRLADDPLHAGLLTSPVAPPSSGTAPPEDGPAPAEPVLDVLTAALQEIGRVVGNELTLGPEQTTRLRGILSAALSRRHARPRQAWPCGCLTNPQGIHRVGCRETTIRPTGGAGA
jgi:hypothetical protein